MRSIMQNKKGQEVSAWVWFAVVVSILVVAPILTYMIITPITEMANQINSTNQRASQAGLNIVNSFMNFWDGIIVFAFVIVTILLFISSFFIDTHAIFVILFLISALILILIAPTINQMNESVWGMSQLSSAVGELPMTQFIMQHIYGITLAIIILSGIITFAKFKYFTSTWN